MSGGRNIARLAAIAPIAAALDLGVFGSTSLDFGAVPAATVDASGSRYGEELARLMESASEKEFHERIAKFDPLRPKDRNWWVNEIGYPHALGVAAAKYREWLTPDEKRLVLDYMARTPRTNRRTGQNKAWIAAVNYYRATLENDEAAKTNAIAEIRSTFEIGGGEGPREDGSFSQHGNQPQWGNYELHFVETAAEFARYLGAEERVTLGRLFDAYGWVVYGGCLDVGSAGRQFAPGLLRRKGSRIRNAADALGFTLGEAKGFRYFPCAAQAVYAGDGWRASVKMSTRKIIGTESYNGDNAKGAYAADGALYFYSRGDEYEDVFPLWDWRHVPGTTVAEIPGGENLGTGSRSFNEADNIQVEGAKVVLELKRGELHAYKSWAFDKRGVIAKGWDITSNDRETRVVTTVEQTAVKGAVEEIREGGTTVIVHDGKRYEIKGGKVIVNRGRRKGDWREIMKRRPSTPAEGEILEILIDHGTAPADAAYEYRIITERNDGK